METGRGQLPDEKRATALEHEPNLSSHIPASLPWTGADTLFAGLVAVAIFLVYAPTLRFPFVLDDIPLILANPAVEAPWSGVPHFFAEGFFDRLSPETPANVYRPVFSLWLLINKRLWGFNSAGWHLAAVLLLVAVSLAVFGITRRLFGSRVLAGFVSLVFALHPLHVECAAWVIGANESLMALFLVLSFGAYLRSRKGARHSTFWLGLSLIAFALALLTKEEAIALPALIAAFEWIYRQTRRWFSKAQGWAHAALGASGPFWAVAVLYLAVRIQVLHRLAYNATEIPLGDILRSIPLVLWQDMRLLLWPADLTIFYDSPYVASATLSGFLLPVMLDLALVTGLVIWGRQSRLVQFASVWCVVPLLPFLDLRILPDGEFIHDRYLYLSSVGFALLLGAGAQRAAEWVGSRLKPTLVAGLCLTLLGLIYGGLTVRDSAFWANEGVLFDRAMTIAPESNFGLAQRAYTRARGGKCDAARELYRRVLARSPRYWRAYFNLGTCHYNTGAFEPALAELAKAAELAPGEPDLYLYIGLAQFRLGHLEPAENALRRAVSLRPGGQGFHLELGRVLEAEGAREAAVEEYRRELAYHPGEAAARAEIAKATSPAARATN